MGAVKGADVFERAKRALHGAHSTTRQERSPPGSKAKEKPSKRPSGWHMSQTAWKTAVAEMIGTFALIFMGAGSILADALTGGTVGITGIALAHGLAIATMVSATGHISGGHLNPAVTAT